MKVYLYCSYFFITICVGLLVRPKKYTKSFTSSNFSTNNAPKSLLIFHLLDKYSKMYGVPKHIAYNMAFLETDYKGPFDWSYFYDKSSNGSSGVMQITLETAQDIHHKKIGSEKLTHNLEFNIMTSMKILKSLYIKYDDWTLACGCYNTGRPMVNYYARYCVKNLDYSDNWISLK